MADTISVVMTTYNGSRFIREQIQSILAQNIQPDEIIICDDRSSDDTADIVREIASSTKVKILFSVNEKNLGYIQNYRKAILMASGDYVFLSDQDDIWKAGKVEKILHEMKDHHASFACTGFQLIDGKGQEITDTSRFRSASVKGYEGWTGKTFPLSFKRTVWGNFSPGCTYCITREVVNIYRKLNNVILPHDFQLQMIAAIMGRAIYIDQPLIGYRIHENNTLGMTKHKDNRKRNIVPLNYRFICDAEKAGAGKAEHQAYAFWVLFLRLPAIRSALVHKRQEYNYIRPDL